MSGHLQGRRANSATCEGKEQFGSYDVADGVAKRRARAGKKGHVYRCGTCGEFHIGSLLVGKRRRRHQIEEEVEA